MWLKVMLVSLFGFTSILTADLGGVMSGNRMEADPLSRPLGEGELDIDGVCSKLGMACQNCTFAVTCIPLLVGWLKIPLQHCPKGQTCNADLQECSERTSEECVAATVKYHHNCEQIGIFPDAYDCRKFHLCSPPEDLPYGRPTVHREAICPRRFGYDPSTGQCSIELENSKCNTRYSVPNCTKIGQTGPFGNGIKHYYVCLSKHGNLHPQIFVCPGPYFWDCDLHQVTDKKTPQASSTTEITSTDY